MKYLFALLLLAGCSAENDLEVIAGQIKECKDFKQKFDLIKPAETTLLINTKVDACKKLKAWD